MAGSQHPWPMREHVFRRHALMDGMMQTAGVDLPAAVHARSGAAFLEARARCRLCRHEQECREWLATARHGQSAPDFCPNARFFAAYRGRES